MKSILNVIYFSTGVVLVAGLALAGALVATFWAFEKLVPY